MPSPPSARDAPTSRTVGAGAPPSPRRVRLDVDRIKAFPAVCVEVLSVAAQGLLDSIRLTTAARAILGSEELASALWQVNLINLLLSVGSLTLVYFLTGIAFDYSADLAFGPNAVLSGVAPAERVEALEALRASLVRLVKYGWSYPWLIISYVLNLGLVSDIAQHTYNIVATQNDPEGPPPRTVLRPVHLVLRDEAYRFLLFGSVVLLSWLAVLIFPWYIGNPIAFIQTSWMMSFYCHDYGWIAADWTIEKRFKTFESTWPYHLGFGAPLALSSFLSFLPSLAVYSLTFPLFVMLATMTPPKVHKIGWPELRMFRLAQVFMVYSMKFLPKFLAYLAVKITSFIAPRPTRPKLRKRVSSAVSSGSPLAAAGGGGGGSFRRKTSIT